MLSPDLVPPEHGTVLGEAHHDKLPSAVGFTVDAFPQSGRCLYLRVQGTPYWKLEIKGYI